MQKRGGCNPISHYGVVRCRVQKYLGVFYPAFSHPYVQVDLKFPLILFSFRLKCNSSLIKSRGFSNPKGRDRDFGDGDRKEMDKRRDHRRSKEVKAMIFLLSSPLLCNRSRY
jgi:hypothetical protein